MYYRFEFSEPGSTEPYATVYQRAAGTYAEGEVAPLGGQYEILRGGFPGVATLKLSGPVAFYAGDRLRIYYGDEALPRYLGASVNDAWPEPIEGEVKLRPLKEDVGNAAWRCPLDAALHLIPLDDLFKPFLLTVLSRCILPPGVTVGDIPVNGARLRANTAFEKLSATLDAVMPAISGAVYGVNTAAQLSIVSPSDDLTDRFVLGEYDAGQGSDSSNYANSVRFPYTRPDGVQAYFEGHVGSEVAARGEVWSEETLPAAVTTTQNNPYSGSTIDLNVLLDHPDNPVLIANVHGLQTALTPTWAGHLADGLNLDPTVLQGQGYQPITNQGEAGNIAVATGTAFSYTVLLDNAPAGLSIEYRVGGGSWTTLPGSKTFAGDSTQIAEWRYVQNAAYSSYAAAHGGVQPPGFNVFIAADPANYARLTVYLPGVSVAQSSFRTLFKARPVPTDPVGSYQQMVIAPFTVSRTRVALPGVEIWRAGDTVTTDVNVTGVVLQDPTTGAEVNVTLIRKDDVDGPDPLHPEVGRRRVWATPIEITASTIVVTGPPASVGWIGAAIADQASLRAYVLSLLRYRTQPVRVWTGTREGHALAPAYGKVAFETAGDDVALEFQRHTYDIGTNLRHTEAGTPLASNYDDALGLVVQNLKRDIRKVQQ